MANKIKYVIFPMDCIVTKYDPTKTSKNIAKIESRQEPMDPIEPEHHFADVRIHTSAQFDTKAQAVKAFKNICKYRNDLCSDSYEILRVEHKYVWVFL